ncbi:MAG: cation:proton antiporter [Longimicrobiales bacterium]|nr:cation:proton antiporter [Longimicrobiales bacterium]
MTGIALLLLAATAGFGAARALRLPALPFLVLAGFALSFTGRVEADFLQDALVLGITFLVFVAGLELNPARLHRQKRAALLVGTVQFGVLGAAGFAAALGLGMDPHTAVYVALALTASSTLVAVRVLQQRRELFEPYGRLVLGVLLLQDALVVLLIPLLTGLPRGIGAAAAGAGAALVLMGVSWTLLRALLPRILAWLSLDEELLILVVLSLLFAFLLLADRLGLPLVVGAFVAGVALSSFPVNGVVRGQMTPITDFFSAVFFTSLGATLGMPSGTALLQALALAALVVLVTPPLVTLLAERAGHSARPAILSGLLLSQTSEFSLVVGLQGVVLNQILPETFSVIVLVTLLTMTLTPLLAGDRVTLALLRLHPTRWGRPEPEPPEGHVLLVGCGGTGMPLLETLLIGPHPLMVLDDDPAVVARVREAGVPALRGDASDPAVLRSAGADRARVVLSTLGRPRDNEALLAAAGSAPVLVRAFDDEDARWISALGGRPVLASEAAAGRFLEWFDRGAGRREDDDLEEVEQEEVL